MGAVWAGTEKPTGHPVAVEFLGDEASRDSEADRELFVASGSGTDDGGGAVDPLLWRVPLGADALPIVASTSAAWAHGEPTFLAVQGGTILRGTDQGLYLHRRADLAIDAETWTWLDVNADETAGPPVLDATLVGHTAVVAAGDEGVVVATLECR